MDEEILNLPWDRFIAGVDLSFTGAEMDQINAGYQEMKTGSVIATGRHKTVRGPAGFSQILVATEFYLRRIGNAEKVSKQECLRFEVGCATRCTMPSH